MKRLTSFAIIAAITLTAPLAGFAADGPATGTTAANPAKASMVHRASTVIGMSVQNAAGKDLGTINDIVLDLKDGKVHYLAVSYGGWLGVGDKLFAVPLKSFQTRYNKDSETHVFVLNIPEERLKNAPGFDQDRWPSFSDNDQWYREVDTYYQTGDGRVSDRN